MALVCGKFVIVVYEVCLVCVKHVFLFRLTPSSRLCRVCVFGRLAFFTAITAGLRRVVTFEKRVFVRCHYYSIIIIIIIIVIRKRER